MSDTASTTRMYPVGAAADEFPPSFAEFAAARARGMARVQANSAHAQRGIEDDHETIEVLVAPSAPEKLSQYPCRKVFLGNSANLLTKT